MEGRRGPHFQGAPCIILAYAKTGERTAPEAATIAIAYLQLAAMGLRLGTCFSNSITYAGKAHPPLIELLGLSEGFTTYMACLVGYPAETFHRIPTRKAIDEAIPEHILTEIYNFSQHSGDDTTLRKSVHISINSWIE